MAMTPRVALTATLRQALLFGLVGLVNTAIGFGVIAAGMALGLDPYAANALGYAAGLTNSFLMNRAVTFRGAAGAKGATVRFLTAFAIAYACNLALLTALLRIEDLPPLAAQGAAMILYTAIFFGLSKWYVFRR